MINLLIILFFVLIIIEKITGLFDDDVLFAILMALFAMHIFANRKSTAATIRCFREKIR